jgi:hypothetical protein
MLQQGLAAKGVWLEESSTLGDQRRLVLVERSRVLIVLFGPKHTIRHSCHDTG